MYHLKYMHAFMSHVNTIVSVVCVHYHHYNAYLLVHVYIQKKILVNNRIYWCYMPVNR